MHDHKDKWFRRIGRSWALGRSSPPGSQRAGGTKSRRRRWHTRAGIERLEERALLTGDLTNAMTTDDQTQALLAGLDGLADFGRELSETGAFAETLNLLRDTGQQELALGGLLDEAVPLADGATLGNTASAAVSPPTITTVKVGSTQWSDAFRYAVDPDGIGYPIPYGSQQLDSLPWSNIRQIFVKFSKDVGSVTASDVRLVGTNGGEYAIEQVEYDSAAHQATITLQNPLGADALLLIIADTVTDAVGGVPLDGEFQTGVTVGDSGNGVAGGDFHSHFNVLPGDVNQSGGASSDDAIPVRNGLGKCIPDALYSILADTNGSGCHAVNDIAPLRQNLGQKVPSSPVVPPKVLGIDPDSGSSGDDGLTNDPAPRVFGSGMAGHEIAVFVDGVQQGTVPTSASDGTWFFDLAPLPDATYTISATQIRTDDPAGPLSSVPSVPWTITIDTTPPVVTASLTPETDSGILKDLVTTHDPADLEVATSVDAVVQLKDGSTGTVLGTTQPDDNGALRFQGVALPAGESRYTVTSTDPAGNSAAIDVAILRLPCDTLAHLTEFTVAAEDAPAAGLPIGRYVRGSADFVGDLKPLVPAANGRVGVAVATLDADSLADVVSVPTTSDEVLVFLDRPDGILGEPIRYASGGSQPATVAVGNFVGGPPLDLAVGHMDGTLSFLEGNGNGSFLARPGLTLVGLGPVVSLSHADFDRDGDEDLVVVASKLTLYESADDPLTASPIRNGDFAQALTGWTTEVLGDRRSTPGRVSVAGGMGQLVENQSFLVSLSQAFTIPPAPQTLSFDLVSLFLDEPQGRVPDAFEVSLLDSSGNSLVPTFRAEATSFLNINPPAAPSPAPGVTFDGTRVTLDISTLSPGTSATLLFDLIGNEPGAGSSAVIDNVRLTPEAIHVDGFERASQLLVLSGAAAASYCNADEDADLDLLVHEPGVPRFTVLTNDGSGQFTAANSGNSPGTVMASAVGSSALGSSYTKFFVLDSAAAAAFRYSLDGTPAGSLAIDADGATLRGIARQRDGDGLWILDDQHDISLEAEHGELGRWHAKGLVDPQGIAASDTTLWVVDAGLRQVLEFPADSSTTFSSQSSTAGFCLDSVNALPTGVTSDGDVLWIVDDGSDAVFVYDASGAPLGTWQLDPANAEPSGIALGGADLWVLDRADRWIYRYPRAMAMRSGSLPAVGGFGLADENQDPVDLADPPIQIGEVVGGSIDTVGEEDQFTFDAALQTLLFDAQLGNSATFDWSLTGPFGETLFGGSFTDFGPIPILQEIPSTFTLTVRGHAGGTGPYQFQIHAVQFITIGDVVIDSLVSADDQRNWVFDVPAGQTLFVDFQELNGGPLSIELLAPDGSVLLADSGTTADELDNGPLTLTDAGLYWLRVAGDGTNTPGYQFQLLDQPPVPPEVRTMNIGEVVSGAIESLNAVDVWEFPATANQSVFFDVQSLTLTPGAFGAIGFQLVSPDGDVLLTSNGSSPDGLDAGPITLPVAGTYSLTVQGFGDTPTYQFQLWDVPPPDSAPINLGDATDGVIETPGATDIWSFSAVAGQSVFIDFTALTARAIIQLDGPDGTTILTDGGSFLDNGPILLPQSGVYRFTVRGSGDRTPAYQFTIWEVRPDVPLPIPVGTLAAPAPVSDLRRPGESLTFVFDAEAGDELALHVSLNDQIANVFTLLSPTGVELLSDVSSDQRLDPLTETGTYSLHITLPLFQPADLHGAFTFEVVNLVAPVIPTLDYRGTEFWLTIPQNTREVLQPVEVSVMLAAVDDTRAIITMPAFDYIRFVDIPAGGLVTIVLPPEAELGGQLEITEDKGIHILASHEVTVFGHSNQTQTSDGFLALPLDRLDTEYLVLGYQATVTVTPNTQLAVLATEDDTTVTITPAGTILGHPAGVPYELQLRRGQTYQLASLLVDGEDVTGTVITSNKPIAVLGGNRCTVVPAGNFDACDYLVEQLPPVGAWGQRFVTLPLASRLGGDTFRMLAQQDGTQISVNGSVVANLNRTQFHEQIIDGPAVISANRPILVAQYANSESYDGITGDPFMMLVPPDAQFDNNYTLPALDDPDYSAHFVNIIVPDDAVGSVTLDGVAVEASDHMAIGSSGFSGAQIPVSVGTHRLSGPRPFGAYVYGFGPFDSYAFTGGAILTTPAIVTSVQLEPETISRPVGLQHTVTATVADQQNQPVPGIPVEFAVTGVNDTSGIAVTDSLGQARFTFTGVRPGFDSIVAFFATLFDTASVEWTASGPQLTIVSPTNGSEFDTGSVQLVTGQALPGDPFAEIVGVTINGQPVNALDGAGNFFAHVTVAAGANQFDVSATDSNGVTANETLQLTGIDPTPLSFDNLADVSNLGRFTYERTTFNRRTRTLHADLRLTNLGTEALSGAALAVFTPFQSPSVALVDAQNLPSPDNRPYVLLEASIPMAGLAAGATSDTLPLQFSNPLADRFTVEATLVVPGNEAPRFTSVPNAVAVMDTQYTYDADATDANRNILHYSLETAPSGMTINEQTGEIDWTPAPSDIGLHSVAIFVSDGYGGSASQSYALRVVEPPPANRDPAFVSTPITKFNVRAGTYQYDALALDSDGDQLNYTLVTAPAGMNIDSLTGQIAWSATASDVGLHDVELQVDDGQGGSATQVFSIQIVDLAPATIEGTKFSDQDGDGEWDPTEPGLEGWTIYIDANDNGRRDTNEPFAVTDPNGNYALPVSLPGTYTVAEQPQIGWQQTSPPAGSYMLTLAEGEVAPGINFGNFHTGDTTNGAPSFTSTPVTSVRANHDYRYDAMATDPNGDPLTFTLVSAPVGMAVDGQSGNVVWRPAANQVTPHTVLLQVTDGRGGTAVQSFYVFVSSEFQPPTITSSPPRIGTAGELYRYHAMAFDPGLEPITFGLPVRPIGMSIDSQTGEATWTPTDTDLGTHRVELRATNMSGLSGYQSFDLDIRPPNTPPRFTTEPVLESAAGELYRYDADAVDDADAITFQLVTAPPGMTINSVTGLVTWRSGLNDHGAHDVTIRATDERGSFADQSYTLTVGPDTLPPVVEILPNEAVMNPGETIQIQVVATDNVGVASRTLEIDGVAVPLAFGGASFTAAAPGLVEVVGSATDSAGNVGATSLRFRIADPADTTPPDVVITSPAPDDVVTYLTQVIGSITGADLEFFRIDSARLDQVDLSNIAADVPGWATDPTPPENWSTFPWTFLAFGTNEVSNGQLAIFDPTMLQNDQYVIRVVAQDYSGNINVRALTVGVEGRAKLGQFSLEFVDLSIPLAGIPIQVTRRYSTLEAARQGDFGFGWSLGVEDADIRETLPLGLEDQFGPLGATPFSYGTRVYITNPEGQRVGFTFEPAGPELSLLGGYFLPKFTPDPGVYDQLEVDPVSLTQSEDGTFHVFLLGAPYNPSDYRLVRPDGTVYRYNQFTGLEGVTDRNDNGLTITDAGITHSSGQSIQFIRDAQGRITQIIDPAGNSIRYTYDARGDLVEVTHQVGQKTQFTYFAKPAHYLDQAIDPLGRVAQRTEYDDEGRVIAITDALGNRQVQSFDPDNFTGTRIDAKGNVTTYVYNDRGNIVELRDPLGGVRTFEYNDPLHPDLETAITDENGHTTRFTYDDRGNLLTQTDALGGVTSWTYDQFNNVTSFTDPLGRITNATYDDRRNLTVLTSPAGDRVQFTYDAEGRPIEQIDTRGGTTMLVYGNGARPTRVTNPDGTSREYTYTDFGALLTATDETGSVTTFVYDASGRLMGRRDHLGNEVSFVYAGNNIVRTTDELGHTTTFEYDDADNVIRQADALGNATTFGYDANGNLASLTDPVGNTTTFTYDALDRVIATTDPLGQVTTFGYDRLGNQMEIVDRNGRRRVFEYDALNRLIRESWFETDTLVRTIDSAYDVAGNLLDRSDPDSSYHVTYDLLDRGGKKGTGPF